MAAYLTMQFQLPNTPSSTESNAGIQQAIWDILDPLGTTGLPNISDGTDIANALNEAATWYSGTTVSQRDTLLANFDIISDTAMYNCGSASGILCGGFQEQLFDPDSPTMTPEPRGQALMMIGLLTVCFMARRKIWQRS